MNFAGYISLSAGSSAPRVCELDLGIVDSLLGSDRGVDLHSLYGEPKVHLRGHGGYAYSWWYNAGIPGGWKSC